MAAHSTSDMRLRSATGLDATVPMGRRVAAGAETGFTAPHRPRPGPVAAGIGSPQVAEITWPGGVPDHELARPRASALAVLTGFELVRGRRSHNLSSSGCRKHERREKPPGRQGRQGEYSPEILLLPWRPCGHLFSSSASTIVTS